MGAKIAPSQPKADVGLMVEDDRILTKNGKRYFPVSYAADLAQVPRTTLQSWISADVTVQGRKLDTYHSTTTRRSYLTEDSVERVAHRFVKWPSKQPAGTVRIGETKDSSGYISLSKAAKAINVDNHTIWLWVTQNKAPISRPLDAIRCAISEQFYISQKDVSELRNLPERPGLRRGRLTRVASQST